MKTLKKLSVVLTVVMVLTALALPTFAASKDKVYNTPIEIVAGITDRTVDNVQKEISESGKSCITIAYEADKLAEFKTEEVKMTKAHLDAEVKAGRLTSAQAEEILERLKENQKNYEDYATGTYDGEYGYGRGYGMGYHRYYDDGEYGYGRGYGHHGRGYNRNYNSDDNRNYGGYGYGYNGRGHCRW